ncbi:MAG: hypothetical protein JXA57_02675, partial [Armatimonadetes bacterium]|nr:hypothetical protein [Armatimonadota bacterium]
LSAAWPTLPNNSNQRNAYRRSDKLSTGRARLLLWKTLATIRSRGEHTFPMRDMIDAVVAAMTVREFCSGRGCAVGGGDGLGTIVLPRALPVASTSMEVFKWPEGKGDAE